MKSFYLFICFVIFVALPWLSRGESTTFTFPDQKDDFFCYDEYRRKFYDRHHGVHVNAKNCTVTYPDNHIQCQLESEDKGYKNKYTSFTIATENDPYKCIQLSDSHYSSGKNVTLSDVKLWGIIEDHRKSWIYQRRVNQIYDLVDDSLTGNYNRKRFEFTYTVDDERLCQYSIEYNKNNIEFKKD